MQSKPDADMIEAVRLQDRDERIYELTRQRDEMSETLRDFIDLCPRVNDDDPIAPALADTCRKARAALAKVAG